MSMNTYKRNRIAAILQYCIYTIFVAAFILAVIQIVRLQFA